MPKIDIAAVPERRGVGYPPPFDALSAERVRQRLGNAGGLTDFGVNLMRLPPGNWSSQRHWHSHEDEFVFVLEGELVLIEDAGETVSRRWWGCLDGLDECDNPIQFGSLGYYGDWA